MEHLQVSALWGGYKGYISVRTTEDGTIWEVSFRTMTESNYNARVNYKTQSDYNSQSIGGSIAHFYSLEDNVLIDRFCKHYKLPELTFRPGLSTLYEEQIAGYTDELKGIYYRIEARENEYKGRTEYILNFVIRN